MNASRKHAPQTAFLPDVSERGASYATLLQHLCKFGEVRLVKPDHICYNDIMKKFWCFFLIAVLLLGCSTGSPEQITVAPAPTDVPAPAETPIPTPDVFIPTAAPATPVPTPEITPAPAEPPTPAPTEPPTAAPTEPPTPEPTLSPEQRLYAYIDGMSTEEKIGQLCMFGFSGTREISSEFRKILQQYHIGNVILYGQNMVRGNSDGGFAQCRKLSDSVRDASRSEIPLLISTDVEGGSVTRFHWGSSLLSARALGDRENTERAYEQFRYIAEGLLSAGINADLAPCLDVAKDPDSTFLGKRIISSDAGIVASIGAACIDGLHEGGCLSIVKHFPGHGATNADSHASTPVVKKTLDSLRDYELVPFAEALSGADGVMVAHIYYPKIDSEHIASQSEVFITDVIRGELGFEGFVMSDDFRMEGLRKQTSVRDGAVQFILAGGDLILCGAVHSYQKQILNGLYEAVEDGTISEQRLNESVYRILSAKMRVTGWDPFENED